MHNKYLLILITLLLSLQTKATTYKSIANGNFHVGATWLGGIVPPTNITTADTIHIAAGTQVTIHNDITLNHPDAALVLDGTILSGATPKYIAIKGAAFYGMGDVVNFDSLYINTQHTVNIAGTKPLSFYKVHADTVAFSGGNILKAITSLHVSGPLVCGGVTTLEINQPTSTIYMRGGSLSEGATGIIKIAGCGELIYTPGAANTTTDIELNGPLNITIDVGGTDMVKLAQDLDISSGVLTLRSGILNLNNNNLRFSTNGDLNTSNGKISSASSSDIEVTTSNGLTGSLTFATGANTLRNLIINTTSGNGLVSLGSDLRVALNLDLQSGKVDVIDHDLSLVAGATIKNAGPFSYVVTDGLGGLIQDIGSNQSKAFPIGTITDYTPINITSKNNTVHNGIKMNVLTDVRDFGNSGSYISATQPCVRHTWHLENTLGSTDVELEVIWPNNIEANGFDRSKAYITMLNGHAWDKHTAAAATNAFANSYALKRDNIKDDGFFTVFDVNTVSVAHLAQDDNISIYPNPAKDVLRLTGIEYPVKSYIYNTAGQLISTELINNAGINISNLSSGLYYLKVESNKTTHHFKFLKE